jgi:uncharacterized peroxidase-related enzyme
MMPSPRSAEPRVPTVRLEVLDRGHRLRARVIMRLAPLLFGTPLDDVGRTSLYRPELFGRAWLALLWDVMVAPSEWSRGDRELLAAFVSNRNRCRYCAGIHTQTATLLGGREITADVLADWRSADFDERITVAFALLEATADADAPHDDAIAAARSAGLSDAAILDVLAVGFVFDLVNRLADAFDFSFGNEDRRLAEARALVRIAYKVPSFFLA